jgi:hypothetical protein
MWRWRVQLHVGHVSKLQNRETVDLEKIVEHVYRRLIVLFGFGKDWVNIPIPKGGIPWVIRRICGCHRRPVPLNWQLGTVIDDQPNLKIMELTDAGTYVFKKRYLYLWAGACPDCTKVYFALAVKSYETQKRLPN